MQLVMKFGGSSLADAQRVRAAAERIKQACMQDDQVVAVVSAQGDTTDRMLEEAASFCPECHLRERDAYLAAGEQMSAALMAMALEEMGCPAVSLTGLQAGILTDGVYGNARVMGLENDRICRELDGGKVVVVAGFQGMDQRGNITTLGRGGSDTTAVALAAYLGWKMVHIYTDVDGVYDRDPRIFADACRLEQIRYGEMLAMARRGAQVLHDRCVELAAEKGVQIRVLSSFRQGPGTLVTD